jgi:hypothetical protein
MSKGGTLDAVGLPVAGFQAEDGEIGGARFGFDAVENGSRDALAADDGADVHAFDLGEATAAHHSPSGERSNQPAGADH